MTENWHARDVVNYAERSLINIMRDRSSGVMPRNRSITSKYDGFLSIRVL